MCCICNACCSCIYYYWHPILQWISACTVLHHHSFPKALVGKRVCPFQIVACVSYTYTGGSSSRHTPPSRWRETVACSTFPKEKWIAGVQNTIDLQWMHPERCVSTHRSRAGKPRTIDLEKSDGQTIDHAAFSPTIAASSVTIANLRAALWSSAPVAIKSTRKAKRDELTRTAKKPNRRIMSCFPGKRYIMLVKANPRPCLRNTAPVAT